jgi:hypothetical protein
MDKPVYYNELVNIREFLEQNVNDFPNNQCYLSSSFVKKILGFEEKIGHYITYFRDTHAFNYDSENNYLIDLTPDQFGLETRLIIVTLDNPFLKVNHFKSNSYKSEKISNSLIYQLVDNKLDLDELVEKYKSIYK